MAFTLGAASLSLWQKDGQAFPLFSPIGLTFPFFCPVHPLKWTTVVCMQVLLTYFIS